ncbi:hypothetical protein MY11210_006737 [Beauveria gryllotalpidicola]
MAPSSDDQNIVNSLSEIRHAQSQLTAAVDTLTAAIDMQQPPGSTSMPAVLQRDPSLGQNDPGETGLEPQNSSLLAQKSGFTSRIVLTGGSYSVYYALAVASRELNTDHRPDFTNTEPAVNIGPFAQWGDKKKIVAMDPWGHLTPWQYKDIMEKENIDLRPTIAITKAHMKLPELEESVRLGRLVPDGKVCLNKQGELAVTKFAVEPVRTATIRFDRGLTFFQVWYLPGVAERFGIDEATLRRSLFEHTGGSYPELITRGDIKVFLPPIGGLTVYCFGDPSKMSDDSVRLSLRIHDECNGSDVFGSDILVYNARKRGADRASDYFTRTENIAGVKDMRFQALMPDILHWLGVKKIDRMLSMSNMKHDAIVDQGIPIHERVELPEELIPADSRVEIDAKITAGYFTAGKRLTSEELQSVQGRMWEDIDH